MNRVRMLMLLVVPLVCFKSYGFDENRLKALRNEDFVLDLAQAVAFCACVGLVAHKQIADDLVSPDHLTNYFIASTVLTAGTLAFAAKRYHVQRQRDTLRNLRFQEVLPQASLATKKYLEGRRRLFDALERPLRVGIPTASIACNVFIDDQTAILLPIITAAGLTLATIACMVRKYQLDIQIDTLEDRQPNGILAQGIRLAQQHAAALRQQLIMPFRLKHRHAPAA